MSKCFTRLPPVRSSLLGISVIAGIACSTINLLALEAAGPAAPWRDDQKNLILVRELNEAYARVPFSREYEGVLDRCPVRLTWMVGPNVPVAWKGGVAGVLDDSIVLVGGLWMPGRHNLAFAYHMKSEKYEEIPPPPFETQYCQGACDNGAIYVIGGRAAGRNVAKLERTLAGGWRWSALPQLPQSEGDGRWLAIANIVPRQWLFLCAGHPTGTPSERRTGTPLADWRLRLDRPDAEWEPMAPYPGGPRALIASAVVRDKLYVFGGAHPDPEMRARFVRVVREFGLFNVPYNGVPQYRDAYCYDPSTDRWRTIRSLPFPMAGGVGIALDDRYILILGETEMKSHRVGKTDRAYLAEVLGASRQVIEPVWTGYGDVVLVYDVEKDNYSRVGVMLYGVATCGWVSDGKRLFGFGGEPYHGYNDNTENVLQIGVIERVD